MSADRDYRMDWDFICRPIDTDSDSDDGSGTLSTSVTTIPDSEDQDCCTEADGPSLEGERTFPGPPPQIFEGQRPPSPAGYTSHSAPGAMRMALGGREPFMKLGHIWSHNETEYFSRTAYRQLAKMGSHLMGLEGGNSTESKSRILESFTTPLSMTTGKSTSPKKEPTRNRILEAFLSIAFHSRVPDTYRHIPFINFSWEFAKRIPFRLPTERLDQFHPHDLQELLKSGVLAPKEDRGPTKRVQQRSESVLVDEEGSPETGVALDLSWQFVTSDESG